MVKRRFHSGPRADIGPYKFRSSWEANAARLFNYLGIIWEYEPKRFYLSKKLSYLPDFKLLTPNPWNAEWIEVKGFWSRFDKRRLKMFANQHPKEKLVVIGREKYKNLAKQYGKLIPLWEGYGKQTTRKKKVIRNGKET